LLDDVTSLARLQAGREHRQLERIDIAPLLHDLCDGMRELADQRHLFLRCTGLASFLVETDAIKTRRIAQNLILNAIKYTHRGGLTVGWGDSTPDDAKRWVLTISDTGPGLHTGSSASLTAALEDATQGAHGVDPEAPEPAAERGEAKTAAPAAHAEAGEGIGLSIVKRLCELLDATIEIESDESTGTTFRILIPRQYAASAS
jgi:signal transduction histidine kinase